MNVSDCIKMRRSIRKYKPDHIDHSIIDSIISIASYSPSWKNTQITRYIAIEDPSILKKIADDYTPVYNSNIIRQIPMLVAVTFIKSRSGFERDGSYSTKKGDRWQMFDVGVACQHSKIPVINAGDGGHQHPTQTLTDLLTILNVKGRLDNMTIGLCGDLKFGRTVHSLITALVRYTGIRFVLISPEELRLPEYIRHDVLDKMNIPYEEVVRLEEAMPKLDILYMTRVQKERFFNEEDYVRMKDFYILDKEKMKLAPEDMYILHPLPRVNEISVDVDDDPRAAYFRQVQYGVYVRMALILTLLDIHVD